MSRLIRSRHVQTMATLLGPALSNLVFPISRLFPCPPVVMVALHRRELTDPKRNANGSARLLPGAARQAEPAVPLGQAAQVRMRRQEELRELGYFISTRSFNRLGCGKRGSRMVMARSVRFLYPHDGHRRVHRRNRRIHEAVHLPMSFPVGLEPRASLSGANSRHRMCWPWKVSAAGRDRQAQSSLPGFGRRLQTATAERRSPSAALRSPGPASSQSGWRCMRS
jgi:hypothetical protein